MRSEWPEGVLVFERRYVALDQEYHEASIRARIEEQVRSDMRAALRLAKRVPLDSPVGRWEPVLLLTDEGETAITFWEYIYRAITLDRISHKDPG